MRWRGETWEQRRQRVMSDWHRWFAFFPIQMRDGSWVWLEYVWRLGVSSSYPRIHWRYSASVHKPDMPFHTSTPPKK